MLDDWKHFITLNRVQIIVSAFAVQEVMLSVWQCWTWTHNKRHELCAPHAAILLEKKNPKQNKKKISAVAYIFYLVHGLLRHEITLHVPCRDKYSISMQQYCPPTHPLATTATNSNRTVQACMHITETGPNQMFKNELRFLRTDLNAVFF